MKISPDHYIDFDGTNLILNVDNNWLKRFTTKFTTTNQRSTSKNVKLNGYINITLKSNDTASYNFRNTIDEVDIPYQHLIVQTKM